MQTLGGVVSTDPSKANQKRDLFGPQTDLTGIPLVSDQNMGGEIKEKTKRELMWEQRM